jgi:hypothetical protein
VDVDYAKWARRRDLDQTIGHAPSQKVGTLKLPKKLRQKVRGQKQVKILEDEDGSVIEDSKGVVLVMKITKLFDQHPDVQVNCLNFIFLWAIHNMFIQNQVVQAGVDFSNTFPFHKSAHREKYADIEDPLFTNGQVHYSKWCSVGHQV